MEALPASPRASTCAESSSNSAPPPTIRSSASGSRLHQLRERQEKDRVSFHRHHSTHSSKTDSRPHAAWSRWAAEETSRLDAVYDDMGFSRGNVSVPLENAPAIVRYEYYGIRKRHGEAEMGFVIGLACGSGRSMARIHNSRDSRQACCQCSIQVDPQVVCVDDLGLIADQPRGHREHESGGKAGGLEKRNHGNPCSLGLRGENAGIKCGINQRAVTGIPMSDREVNSDPLETAEIELFNELNDAQWRPFCCIHTPSPSSVRSSHRPASMTKLKAFADEKSSYAPDGLQVNTLVSSISDSSITLAERGVCLVSLLGLPCGRE